MGPFTRLQHWADFHPAQHADRCPYTELPDRLWSASLEDLLESCEGLDFAGDALDRSKRNSRLTVLGVYVRF